MALLPALAGLSGAAGLMPAELADGFRTAVFIAGATCAAGGLVAVLTITNPRRTAAQPLAQETSFHCALGGPPLRGDAAPPSGQTQHAA